MTESPDPKKRKRRWRKGRHKPRFEAGDRASPAVAPAPELENPWPPQSREQQVSMYRAHSLPLFGAHKMSANGTPRFCLPEQQDCRGAGTGNCSVIKTVGCCFAKQPYRYRRNHRIVRTLRSLSGLRLQVRPPSKSQVRPEGEEKRRRLARLPTCRKSQACGASADHGRYEPI